jgi:predicted DNA-binding transcriptional regulator YafY
METWLPPLMLKFLVFLVFTCVIAGAMIGLLQGDLSTNRLWIILGGMVALLLLLAIDRLTSLKVSPSGVEATLAEAQAKALEEVALLEDHGVAQAAREKILEARNPGEVEGAMAVAMRLNVTKVVERVQQAIGERRRLYIRYMPEPGSPLQAYQVAPLDIKPGKTARTKSYDYLWVYSYEHEHILSLRLERVLGVELSEETFDPADVTGAWREAWNVERDWDTVDKQT